MRFRFLVLALGTMLLAAACGGNSKPYLVPVDSKLQPFSPPEEAALTGEKQDLLAPVGDDDDDDDDDDDMEMDDDGEGEGEGEVGAPEAAPAPTAPAAAPDASKAPAKAPAKPAVTAPTKAKAPKK